MRRSFPDNTGFVKCTTYNICLSEAQSPSQSRQGKIITLAYSIFQVLAITPVVVHDGGIEHLSPEHIHLLVDLQKLGLRPGDIHFSVLVGPHHGSLAKERLKTSDVITTFTYR